MSSGSGEPNTPNDDWKHEIGAVNCGCGWHPSCVENTSKEPK